jgi:hypothetical protein
MGLVRRRAENSQEIHGLVNPLGAKVEGSSASDFAKLL